MYRVGAVNHDWDGSWTLLAFSLPDSWQRQRHYLRSQLTWAGFGPLQGGLWIAPGSPDVRAISAGLGLDAHVRVFRARADELTDIAQLIRDAYDIDELAARYRAFAQRRQPLVDTARSADPLAAQLRLIVDWLQIVRRDPHLPVRHLPPDWPAVPAQEVFMRLQHALFGGVLLADPAGGFDTVDAGHPDVHQDQVDGVVPEERDDLESIGEITRDNETRVEPEHRSDAGPDVVLVVDDQNPRHETTAPTGLNSARTRNRPPALSIVSRPPDDSTRSRIPTSPSPLPEPEPRSA